MAGETYNILFLCTRNRARSIIAEAIVNREGHGRFRAFSAGTEPASQVRPEVIGLLKRLNFNAEAAHAKSLKDLIRTPMPPLDFIFTLCDQTNEKTCPVWPGHPATALWPIRDPKEDQGSTPEQEMAYVETYRTLNTRLSAFMNMPFDRLDQLSSRDSLGSIEMTPQSIH
ncbi:MAG: arsenate reductase ArsC [Roseibium sp.]|uniref:arsenate reductase ArsC n=1 Tax=Roseibium sp. TaxID=1936156 RepID=UPI0026088929|nr:arsenate reductase ArsC [Roseibium sp.]MCV0426040.1 arsenate reductase ArsC [Roseibium sp.]